MFSYRKSVFKNCGRNFFKLYQVQVIYRKSETHMIMFLYNFKKPRFSLKTTKFAISPHGPTSLE